MRSALSFTAGVLVGALATFLAIAKNRQHDMAATGATYPVDLDVCREGYYDSTIRYLVWEPDDVRRIIALLQGVEKDEADDRP